MKFSGKLIFTLGIIFTSCLWYGCRTGAVKQVDVHPVFEEGRPLVLSEVLSAEEIREAEGWAEYAAGAAMIVSDEKSLEDAAAHYSRAFVCLPESEILAERLFALRAGSPDYGKSLQDVEPAVKANPCAQVCNVVYANLLEALEKRDEAIVHLQGVFEKTGFRLDKVGSVLARQLTAAGRYKEAETVFAQLFTQESNRGNLQLSVSYLLFLHAYKENADGKPENHEYFSKKIGEAADGLAELKIEDVSQFKVVSEALIAGKHWQQLDRLIESCEKNAALKDTVAFAIGKLRFYELSGDTRQLDALLASYSRLPELNNILREHITDLYTRRSDYASAVRMFEPVFLMNPEAVPARMKMGRLYLANGEYDKAQALFETLMNIPADAYFMLAVTWREKGDLQKAYQYFTKAEKAAIKFRRPILNPAFYRTFSLVCEALERKEEAVQKAKSAYEIDMEDAASCNFYGYLLADNNMELELAEELLRKALKAEPDNYAYLDSMAWIYYRQGKYELALEYILKAVEEDGEADGVIAEHAGDIALANGLPELAAHFWNIAASAGGVTAKGVLEKLEKLKSGSDLKN